MARRLRHSPPLSPLTHSPLSVRSASVAAPCARGVRCIAARAARRTASMAGLRPIGRAGSADRLRPDACRQRPGRYQPLRRVRPDDARSCPRHLMAAGESGAGLARLRSTCRRTAPDGEHVADAGRVLVESVHGEVLAERAGTHARRPSSDSQVRNSAPAAYMRTGLVRAAVHLVFATASPARPSASGAAPGRSPATSRWRW